MRRTREPRRTSDWVCDAELETAARFVSDAWGTAGTAARLRAGLSRPGLAAVLGVLRSVPRVTAAFSAGPAGVELRGWFTAGRVRVLSRVPVALLDVPATHAEYLRGRPRQALRTNVNRATALGVTCTPVTCPAELAQVIAEVAAGRHQDPATMVRDSLDAAVARRFVVARDAGGRAVALSETVVDGDWAGLATLVTVVSDDDGPLGGQVLRYLLHAETVRDLIGQGVRHLVVSGSMLLSTPGTRYFQRRTGYVPVWLRPAAAPAPALVPAPAPAAAAVPRPRAAADAQPAAAVGA